MRIMTDDARPPLAVHRWRHLTGDDDLPDDRYTGHVNNARYFHFINRCLRGWYIAMGLRDLGSRYGAMMVRSEYDFLREVHPPSWIECEIEVVRLGRSSIEHAVRMFDRGESGEVEPVQVGRGRLIHACFDRQLRRTVEWPDELARLCWAGERSLPRQAG